MLSVCARCGTRDCTLLRRQGKAAGMRAGPAGLQRPSTRHVHVLQCAFAPAGGLSACRLASPLRCIMQSRIEDR